MYTKQVIKQCINETKNFKTLKDYSEYVKNYRYNDHHGLYPSFIQQKIQLATRILLYQELMKHDLFWEDIKLFYTDGVNWFTIERELDDPIEHERIEALLNDLTVPMNYECIRHEVDKYLEYKFREERGDDE